ncbi:metalloregulator ArsR/SmtB family transcription factor [Brevundimonas sp. 2R-24]|uniref:Metalloregulator ArsR/SmtB family transcription factor n=1 Tax=Peiella sedimenti TaxID=3061083 RepID=A0ABT8SNE3_9CAUL|nr:metalloregulator ArsR/SmtB family transcription factor [Caulobacteraceae bacterium XZ-24]
MSKSISPPPMDPDAFRGKAAEAAELLKALSHDGRLLILCALAGGETPAGALMPVTGLSQSALSQHLARLREQGLVRARREGVVIHYSIADTAALRVVGLLAEIFCAEKENQQP